MKPSIILCIVASFAISAVTFADPGQGAKNHAPGSCQQIKKACEDAGFIKGEWKNGYGLWRDCIDPIMQGKTTVTGATRALPSVDAGVVAACKAKHPKFGEGKFGSQ
jgi:hypothetical protein